MADHLENIRPGHRLELREKGFLNNLREGPYITHNVLVTHVNFLRKVNEEETPCVFRILPFGGSFSTHGDVTALIVWYIMLVYVIVAIPIACYCEDVSINIINTCILAILFIYHSSAIYLIISNMRKLKKMWCSAMTTAEKYIGLQNYFIDATTDNVIEINLVSSQQKQKIIQKLNTKADKQVVVMLITSSYKRSRLRDPIICLTFLALFSFAGIMVQLETMRVVHLSKG